MGNHQSFLDKWLASTSKGPSEIHAANQLTESNKPDARSGYVKTQVSSISVGPGKSRNFNRSV